jgi:methylmalonyl-CoA mutase C-terminal domain/subunit
METGGEPAAGSAAESRLRDTDRRDADLGRIDPGEVDLRGTDRPLRIVVAKPGLDGHDRGAKVIARALRDAGMEVIYTGLHQTPEQIVRTAIAEDADGIGLSILSGAHLTLFARVMELLAENDAGDIVVFGGGIIPEGDRASLKEMGVAGIFTPGATMAEIVQWVRANVGTSSPI